MRNHQRDDLTERISQFILLTRFLHHQTCYHRGQLVENISGCLRCNKGHFSINQRPITTGRQHDGPSRCEMGRSPAPFDVPVVSLAVWRRTRRNIISLVPDICISHKNFRITSNIWRCSPAYHQEFQMNILNHKHGELSVHSIWSLVWSYIFR
jgi:hypothetical protein